MTGAKALMGIGTVTKGRSLAEGQLAFLTEFSETLRHITARHGVLTCSKSFRLHSTVHLPIAFAIIGMNTNE